MKVKNLLAAAALCLFAGNASAQVNSYGSIYFQYNPAWVSNLNNYNYGFINDPTKDNNYVNCFTLGYFQSIGIGGDKVPLFLEVGGNLQYGFHTYTISAEDNIGGVFMKDEYKFKSHMLALNIPINFGYSIRLGDNLALNPYVGIRMRLNLLGVNKRKSTEVLGEVELTQDKTVNMFSDSEDNMRNSDYTWNRFQIGWQAGVKMIISEAFFVEAGYTMDFNRLGKVRAYGSDFNLNTSSVNLGFGLVF